MGLRLRRKLGLRSRLRVRVRVRARPRLRVAVKVGKGSPRLPTHLSTYLGRAGGLGLSPHLLCRPAAL